jgi:ABC-type transport system involved in multi-copper enzyme maturation permease subunit
MFLLAAASGWLNTWLTPLWLIGLGALLGLVLLLIAWGITAIFSRSGAALIPEIVTEGPLFPIFVVVAAAGLFGVAGWLLIRDRAEIISSLARLPSVGEQSFSVSVPAALDEMTEPEPVEVQVEFRGDELQRVEIQSNESLALEWPTADESAPALSIQVMGGDETAIWTPSNDKVNPLAGETFASLVVRNQGTENAQVKLRVVTAPQHPEVKTIFITAIGVAAIFLSYMVLRWLFPKVSAVAMTTAKSEMAQPLYFILVMLGLAILFIFMWIPYHTFGEDIKVLKDTGLTLILVFCILQAVWGASESVAEEIEGRTALTLLSKPIGRRQFVFGKFLGIAWTSLTLFVILGMFLLVVVGYKPIYDARETSATSPIWQVCHLEIVQTVPGLVLAFLETLVFIAISVAISTRLPLLANIVICFAIYALGHLTPLIVQSSIGKLETVAFIGNLIALILPVLDHFNIQAAVAAGVEVPTTYLVTAAAYCVLYCTIVLLLALVLFEDRDLA